MIDKKVLRHREAQKKYKRSLKGKATEHKYDASEKGKKLKANWRKKSKHKVKVHNLVYKAISLGALVRQPCEICSKQETDAHHDDYSKPLDVKWLCRVHHTARHKKLG